jgi:hypothetical protein
MQRFEPALCQCGFGLLCCASGIAGLLSGVAMLIFR